LRASILREVEKAEEAIKTKRRKREEKERLLFYRVQRAKQRIARMNWLN
jgi:hypothetical protein